MENTNSNTDLKDQNLGPALGYFANAYDEMQDSLETQFDSEATRFQVGRSYYQLGKVHYDKSDLRIAEENFIKAYQYAERPRDHYSIFKILGFLIRIASEKLEDDKANTYIVEAEKIVVNLSETLGSLSAEYFYNVGIISTYKGEFDEARLNYELAFKKSKEENEPELLAKTLLALAVNCQNRKDFEKSLDFLNQLGQLLKIIDKNYLTGAMYLHSAKAFAAMGIYDKALQFYKFANISLQEKKCWNLYGYILLGKGIVYKQMGNYEKALDYFLLTEESSDRITFRRLGELISSEIQEVNDNSVDLYLDRTNRKVKERYLGTIDFKHRFVLLEILFLLARSSGEFFDKEQLAREIWKDEYNPLIHDKLIYTSVSRLRKLIEPKNDRGEKRKYIIRGKDGYTFSPQAKIRFHMETRPSVSKSIGNVDISSPV